MVLVEEEVKDHVETAKSDNVVNEVVRIVFSFKHIQQFLCSINRAFMFVRI